RLREHHQFGIEYFGADSYMADIEVMLVAKTIFDKLGIGNLVLNINSIGCSECRKKYNDALKEYLSKNFNQLCPTCQERFEKNPLRVLDCKVDSCKEITKNAPAVIDYLCDDCKAHHDNVCRELTNLGIDYVVNPKIVRGLDYYTRTVFEFVSNNIGAQGTVCGGGRYNNLVEEVGGKPCPAVGFGMGLERLLLTLEGLGLSQGQPYKPDVYIAPICAEALSMVNLLAMRLRRVGLCVESDIMNRSFKAQLKYADKIEAKYLLIVGEDEIKQNKANIKDMTTGESVLVDMNEIEKFWKK
ncbi:MAG: histidine--tRNA ligase, partial [Clostridia bacterium]